MDPTDQTQDPEQEQPTEEQLPQQEEELPPSQATSKELNLPDDVVNLVPTLLEIGKTDTDIDNFIRKDLPAQICEEFDEDWEARKGWFEKRAERMKLFLGELEPKEEPFANCANMHVPIIQERVLRLAHRVYAELIPQPQQRMVMFTAIPASTDPGEKERTDIITLFENWQFQKDCPGFKQNIRRSLIEFFNHGECTFHSFRDVDTDKNVHEFLSADDFVYPYTSKPPSVDMSDVPRKTKILRKYKREIRRMQAKGLWAQVDEMLKQHAQDSFDEEIDEKVKKVLDAYHGDDKTERTKDVPIVLLEYHGWAKFPHQEDDTPIRVVLDYKTKTVLALFKREYDDPEDRIRFDKQHAEFDQYTQNMSLFTQGLKNERALLERIKQPDVHPADGMLVAQQTINQSPPQPTPPPWMEHDEGGMPKPPEPCKQKVIEQFSHAICIEAPQGSHGLGIGQALLPYQAAANILLNQFVDSATLANSTTAFMHEAVRLPPGMKSISPNRITRVRGVPIDMMEKAIWKLKSDPANPQLLDGMKTQIEAADGVASAPDVLSGERAPQETFRGQAGRIEQAVRQLTVFASNYVEMLSNVEKQNAVLNFQHLDGTKIMAVLDPRMQQMRDIKVSRDLYRDDYTIIFAADLRFASQAQRISEDDDVLGMLTKAFPPQLATLVFKPQIFAQAARNCLTSRQKFDMLAYVNSDQDIEAKIQQQSMQPPPGAPPGAPHPGAPPGAPPPHQGGPVPPAVPSGHATTAPGAQPPQTRVQQGVPAEAAPSK